MKRKRKETGPEGRSEGAGADICLKVWIGWERCGRRGGNGGGYIKACTTTPQSWRSIRAYPPRPALALVYLPRAAQGLGTYHSILDKKGGYFPHCGNPRQIECRQYHGEPPPPAPAVVVLGREGRRRDWRLRGCGQPPGTQQGQRKPTLGSEWSRDLIALDLEGAASEWPVKRSTLKPPCQLSTPVGRAVVHPNAGAVGRAPILPVRQTLGATPVSKMEMHRQDMLSLRKLRVRAH